MFEKIKNADTKEIILTQLSTYGIFSVVNIP